MEKYSSNFIFLRTICAVSLLSVASGQALAQSTSVPPDAAAQGGQDSAESSGLVDIIVTAQRRAEPLQSVPVAVSAFSAGALQNSNIGSVQGLQGLVPSLTIDRSGFGLGIPQMSLRGISIQDIEKSVESGIGVTLDGVPLGFSSGMLLNAFDVERIEVLRGPQGLLFGKNTTGGTINVIRSRPDPNAQITGKVRVTLGSFARRDIEGVISAPLIPGKLAAKFAATVQKNHGEFRNIVYGGHDGDKNLKDFNVAFNATPTDDLSILLTLERLEDDSDIVPFTPLLTPNIVPLGVPGYFGGANYPCFNPFTADVCVPLSKKRNTVENAPIGQSSNYFNLSAATLEASYKTGPVKLVNILGYRDTKENIYGASDSTRYNLFAVRKPQKTWQVSEEFRAESDLDGPFNFVAGVFFFKSKYSGTQRVSLDLAALPPAALGLTDPLRPGALFLNSLNNFDIAMRSRSVAVFFQGDYQITDKFKLIAGARQTWDRKSIEYEQFAPVAGTSRNIDLFGPSVGTTKQSARFKKLTPKVGLEYQAARRVLVYGSWSRGYNTGGFNGRPPSPALVKPYQPETMDAFEIGVKSDLLNNHVRFNVAAFHNTLKNKQEDLLLISGTANGTVTLNAAKARYKGFEVELGLVPVRGWTISSSLGYLDAKYVNFSGNLGQGFRSDLTMLKLRRTPKWTAGLVSDYTTAVADGKLGLNARFSYTSRYETNVLNDPRGSVPKMGMLDLSARYEFPSIHGAKVQISAFVQNVTDNTTLSGNSSGNSVGTFIEFDIPRVGRTWGTSLQVGF